MTEKLKLPSLTGVPETMLWPLYNRAVEARLADSHLIDPHSVRIADALDYDYARSFGRPDYGHVLRALSMDGLLCEWLQRHPSGQVVALGEGLETQFHRVDNGTVRWLSVDLPEAIEVRARFIPETDRHRNLACSALDFSWMDQVMPGTDVFVTAAGLLMYLQPDEVRRLISAIAVRFPKAEMAFDTIPRWIVKKTLRGWKKTAHYTLPTMPWGMDHNEIPSIREWHPNIAEVNVLPYSGGRGFLYRFLIPILLQIPKLREQAPSFTHLRFATPAQTT